MSEAATEGAAATTRRKKLALIGVAVLVVGAGLYLTVLKPAPDDAQAAPPRPVEGEVVDVEQMTVNLAGPQLHYARLSFAVVLEEAATADAVTPRFPLLKDAALSTVGTYSPDVLRTPKGVDRLRRELSQRARALYPDGEVLRVVLTELIVQ